MFCPECGKGIGKGEKFCSDCGAKIEESESAPHISSGGKQILSLSDKQILSLIGGVLLIISFFMPWIDIIGLVSVSGFNLLKLLKIGGSTTAKLLALIAWFVPIGGGITAYLAYTKRSTAIASLFTVAIALFVLILVFCNIAAEIEEMVKWSGSSFSFKDIFEVMGFGLYIMLGGIVCLGISIMKRG